MDLSAAPSGPAAGRAAAGGLFDRFPRQFALTPAEAPAPGPLRDLPPRAVAAGWRVHAAPAVPVMAIRDAAGAPVGALIGWAILDGRLLRDGEVLTLPPGGDPAEDLLADLAGRAVCLWRASEGPVLQLDSAGLLPAVHAAEPGLVASTSTLLALLSPREVDAEVAGIYDFPARRGYLPFRLAHHRGVARLLPGHRLDLGRFEVRRVWPSPGFAAAPRQGGAAAEAAIRGIAEGLRRRACAVAAAVDPPRLNLTAGYDSRLVLAALRPEAHRLICQTVRHDFGALPQDNALDVHVAARLAALAGARHERIDAVRGTRADLEGWLERTGRTYCEAPAQLAATMTAEREALTLDGVGAEMLRAVTWSPDDLGVPALDRRRLLARLRLPAVPRIEAEAERWLAEIPPCDATRALDLAKIDLMHGCWFGPTVYGPPLPVPTLSPFPTRRTHEALMGLPDDWRIGGRAWRLCLAALWPELGRLPVNRAEGAARLRFLASELKRAVPTRVKRWIRPHR